MNENILLERIADLADVELMFKNKDLLPGTAWIDQLPIDIEIRGEDVYMIGVGMFSGNQHMMSKGEFRGKKKFQNLVPYIKQALIEMGFKPELYLTPISPVWERNYDLVQANDGRWKIVL